MYVACRVLKVQKPGDTAVRTVQPGELVPEAAGWPYPTLIAHLNLQWLKWDGEEHPPHEAHRRQGVVIPMVFRDMAPKPPRTTDTAPPAPLHAQDNPKGATAQAEAPASPNSCTECGRAFGGEKALRSHLAKKHPKAGANRPQAG